MRKIILILFLCIGSWLNAQSQNAQSDDKRDRITKNELPPSDTGEGTNSLESRSNNLPEVHITISEKHKQKLEKISSPAQKLKKYRKFYAKDSSRLVRKHAKLIEQKSDSLINAFKNSIKDNIRDSIGMIASPYGKYLGNEPLDSANLIRIGTEIIKDQSQLNGLEEYEKIGLLSGEYPELASWLKNYGSDPGKLGQLPDSVLEYSKERGSVIPDMIENRIGQTEQIQELQRQSGSVGSVKDLENNYKNLGEGYLDQAQQYTDVDKLQSGAKEMISEKTRDFLLKYSQQLDGINQQMNALKKKYSSLPKMDDMSTAVKRNSLKGRPADEKLILGGNFDIQLGDPILVDVSPLLGIRLNKKLTIGAGGTFRTNISFEASSNKIQNEDQVYGANGFVSYDVIKRFFIYGQYDYLSNKTVDKSSGEGVQYWKPGVMAGIGRSFNVHPKLTGTVMLLYNVLENDIKSPSGNKFQVKFGFQTNELTFKKVNRPF